MFSELRRDVRKTLDYSSAVQFIAGRVLDHRWFKLGQMFFLFTPQKLITNFIDKKKYSVLMFLFN